MVQTSEFNTFADGGEIVADAQGFTSFLCQKASNDTKLSVAVYNPEVDADDESQILKYNRKKVDMYRIYETANENTRYRVLGGVAFLRFGLGFSYSPGAYKSTDSLPEAVMLEVKIKIDGFHNLYAAGGTIKQISNKKNKTVEY